MVFAFLFRAVVLFCLPLHAGEPLGVKLDSILRLDSEKVSAGSVVSPKILVSGKPFKRSLILFRSEGGVALSTPIDETSSTLRQVFLNLENGGIYLVDPSHPEAVKAKLPTRYVSMNSSDKTEAEFLRQFAHLLQQRHPNDPSTAKFFKFYFGVEEKPESPEGFEQELSLPSSEPGKKSVSGAFSLLPKDQPVDLVRLFNLMANPQDWTGLDCTNFEADGGQAKAGKRCRYEHATLGQMVLEHPGAADVLFEDAELFDP
jgi:hypothetical protein